MLRQRRRVSVARGCSDADKGLDSRHLVLQAALPLLHVVSVHANTMRFDGAQQARHRHLDAAEVLPQTAAPERAGGVLHH
jgi:hypothetical protein